MFLRLRKQLELMTLRALFKRIMFEAYTYFRNQFAYDCKRKHQLDYVGFDEADKLASCSFTYFAL